MGTGGRNREKGHWRCTGGTEGGKQDSEGGGKRGGSQQK